MGRVAFSSSRKARRRSRRSGVSGAVDPMCQLCDRDRTQSSLHFTDLLSDLFEELSNREMLPLGFDNNTGVENHSQAGGLHRRLRPAIPSSTSFMKPSS